MNAALKNKKILVTGGAGFIGSELVRQLVYAGACVTVIDSLVNGKKENLAGLAEKQVHLVVSDIRDPRTIGGLLEGVEVVFHLACLGVRHSIHSPKENHEVNATGTLELLSAARDARVKRFVHVSSSEVYGTACETPMSENHPAFPHHVYGAAKLAGECYARAFYEIYGFPAVILRPFNTYGIHSHHEGDSGEVIPRFLLRSLAGRPMVIFGDGLQTRDFTYVEDMARGILLAAAADQAVGETINLGSGAEVSIKELAHKIAGLTARPGAEIRHDKPRPGDVRRLLADTAKARRLLGFKTEVSLQQGLEKLRNWYGSLGASPESLLEREILHNWKPPKARAHV